MYIDLLLLFLIILFGVLGYIHGFIRQVLSLLALLAIIFFSHPLASWLKENSGWSWFEHAPILINWGLSSLFLMGLFLVTGGVITLMKKESGLEPTDRWLGVALGTLKGFVLALCLGLVFQVLPEKTRERFSDIHHDSENSYFIKMSSGVLEWKSISSFKSLHDIRRDLQSHENPFQKPSFLEKTDLQSKSNSREGPWAKDVGAEKD
ncbi:MAG: CvpA family protein [Deltaproteobacteria bacterium]|nr:CvpA family protein [Deltaproteobacteria bacterium]